MNLKDSLLFQAGPMDAGTDSGFTFTAPNWPSEPRQKISHITAQEPSHPANSFYYPEKQRLPPIATFHFHKVRRQPSAQLISAAGIKSAEVSFLKHASLHDTYFFFFFRSF
jgi:hypothetical protein